MYLEFCNYNKSFAEDLKAQREQIFKSIDLGFDGICVPLFFLRHIKDLLSGIDINIATCVDYPSGIADRRVRMHATSAAIRSGASCIDLVISPYLISENKHSTLINDIKSQLRICREMGADLRPIIRYDLYDIEKSIFVANILAEAGVDYIIPSTGYHNDDIYDNIIFSTEIEDKTYAKAICSGHIWLREQYERALNSNFFGLRLYSLKLF